MTTITIPKALLEQALGALVRAEMMYRQPNQAVQAALRAELAKPEQEESFIPDWANYRQGVADGKAGSPKWHDAPEVAALKAERDAAMKDAERYRWLVQNSFDKTRATQIHCWLHTWEPHYETTEPQEWKQRIRGPALDIFIDAAIAKAEGRKE